MTHWVCPDCEREFTRVRQSHSCWPGNSVADTFTGRPPEQREIAELIIDHLRSLGPLHVDPVTVGIFLKAGSKLAELRPKKRWVSLELVLPEHLASERIQRHIRLSGRRIVNIIRLYEPADVDDEIREWLTYAYAASW